MTDSAIHDSTALNSNENYNDLELEYPPASSPVNDANDTEDEELEEQIHLKNVIQTFEQYAPFAVFNLSSPYYHLLNVY